MSDAGSRGPQVDASENLYRAITAADWWDRSVEPPRVRSFAFKVDTPFSVNVASILGLQGACRHMREVLRCPRGGIVVFNCGEARSIGFDARHEPDPDWPDNTAHANVYFDGSGGSRKRAAKRLAEKCQTAHHPSF